MGGKAVRQEKANDYPFFMSKRQFALGFLFIFIFWAGLVTQETDSEQIHTDINKANMVEEWQINPEAFAKLFFGNDLRVRSSSKGVTILRENAERVKGARVEWTFTFGISPSWLILPKEIQMKTRLGNPDLPGPSRYFTGTLAKIISSNKYAVPRGFQSPGRASPVVTVI